MPVRFITKDEMLSLRKIDAIAFVASFDQAKCEDELRAQAAPEKGHIAYFTDDGTMTAGMILPEFDMVCPAAGMLPT